MIADPALRFWLRYADRQGAVSEEGTPALVLLPPALQSAWGLPEEVAVTAEPDVARDDGALLLIPGHPVVESAVAAVLDEGDVGWAQLAWPTSLPPSTSVLEARAREWFIVDHGRIDAAGEAASIYLPVLRVGALVSYGVSLDHRFREREEVWVDAQSGLVLSDHVRHALQAWPRAAGPDRAHSCLVPDLGPALAQADSYLRARADARLRALASEADGARRDQLARADAYFEAALASIAQRRAAATRERQAMLDAQAEATRQEHARRLAEIEETFAATCTLTPFRAHLLLVPALCLPVRVRRGPRTFPLSFTWIMPAGAFAGGRCPHCGADATLVAGRERLGCRSCLPTPTPTPTPAPAPAPVRVAPPPPPATRPSAQARPHATDGGPPSTDGTSASRQPSAAPRKAKAVPGSKRVTAPADRTGEEHLCRVGDKLAVDFWRLAGNFERWPRRSIEPCSPLAAVYRLYGPSGPAFAIGVPHGSFPACVAARTFADDPAGPATTTGVLSAGGIPYPYTLRWRLEGRKPVVAEVLPFAAAHGNTLPPDSRLARVAMRRLFGDAPPPRVELDPVAAALWRDHLAVAGLPVILRALAAWWRAQPDLGEPDQPATVVAAAVLSLVGARASRPRLRSPSASAAPPAAVAEVAATLQTHLRLSRSRPW